MHVGCADPNRNATTSYIGHCQRVKLSSRGAVVRAKAHREAVVRNERAPPLSPPPHSLSERAFTRRGEAQGERAFETGVAAPFSILASFHAFFTLNQTRSALGDALTFRPACRGIGPGKRGTQRAWAPRERTGRAANEFASPPPPHGRRARPPNLSRARAP